MLEDDIIAKYKKKTSELAIVNRVLRMLSESNQALIRITDEVMLLNEICRIVVEVGGYRMTWVGFVEQDDAKTLRSIAHAGFESGYIESTKLTWADSERGCGPGGTVIRSGKPYLVRNIHTDPSFAPWRESALQRGYQAIIVLPLVSEGLTFGTVCIYAGEADAFDDREVEVLNELAGNLAYGITALRTRAKRDQSEEALKRSEENYRRLLDTVQEGIWVIDKEAVTTFVNPRMAEILGYTPAEMIGKHLFSFMDEQGKLIAEYNIERRKQGIKEQHDFEFIKKDGERIYTRLETGPIFDEVGHYIGSIAAVADITERKEAERRLQESETRLRLTLEATQIGIWDWDVKNDQWYASTIYYTMLGYEPRTGPADRNEWLERLHPDDRVYVKEKIQDVLSRDFKEYQYEARMRHADGTYRWQQVMGFGIERDQDGKVSRMLGIRMDIHDHKLAEEALRRLNEELEQRVKDRTAELEQKNRELERTNRLFVGRELRMIELKDKIRELEREP